MENNEKIKDSWLRKTERKHRESVRGTRERERKRDERKRAREGQKKESARGTREREKVA